MSKRRKVLIAAVHHWHSPIKVGTHYIAELFLSMGFDVAYVSAPVTPLHFFLPSSKDLDARRATHLTRGEYLRDGQLWHYVPHALIAPNTSPLLSSYPVLRYWQITSIPNLKTTVAQHGFDKVDVLFLDSIYQCFWLRALPHRASAYRISDNTAGFKGYSQAAARIEAEIIQSVNQVFVASQGLLKYASRRGAKEAILAANGVDLPRFRQKLEPNSFTLQVEGPTAVYVGAISYWFDHDLVSRLAVSFPELTIFLIGPFEDKASIYADTANVKLVGEVSPAEIPRYLHAADVGLIPFNTEKYSDLIADVNPLKLYEYMAAGLPVVATEWRELGQLKSPAYLARDQEKFIEYVRNVIANPTDGQNEKAFAERFDWSSTLIPLQQWLNAASVLNASYHTLL